MKAILILQILIIFTINVTTSHARATIVKNAHESHAALADISNNNVVITQSDVMRHPNSGALNTKITIYKPMGFEIDLLALPFQCQETLTYADMSICSEIDMDHGDPVEISNGFLDFMAEDDTPLGLIRTNNIVRSVDYAERANFGDAVISCHVTNAPLLSVLFAISDAFKKHLELSEDGKLYFSDYENHDTNKFIVVRASKNEG